MEKGRDRLTVNRSLKFAMFSVISTDSLFVLQPIYTKRKGAGEGC